MLKKSMTSARRIRFRRRTNLQPLHPFLDKKVYLRVDGRLQHSHLPYDPIHQLILPPAHHFTELVIMNEHLRFLHAGPQLLSASLRQQYWIPRMKLVICVQLIFLLVLRSSSFPSQTLPIQQRTAYPDGSEFNASISSCGKGGPLTA
jgi:hypothetical protein